MDSFGAGFEGREPFPDHLNSPVGDGQDLHTLVNVTAIVSDIFEQSRLARPSIARDDQLRLGTVQEAGDEV